MLCIHRSEPGVNERLRELARNMLCDYDKDKNKGSKIPTYRIYTYMMLLFFFSLRSYAARLYNNIFKVGGRNSASPPPPPN